MWVAGGEDSKVVVVWEGGQGWVNGQLVLAVYNLQVQLWKIITLFMNGKMETQRKLEKMDAATC